MRNWNSARSARDSKLRAGARYARGKLVAAHDATALLEAVLSPGDRVCLEGDNQKQADLLAAALAAVDNHKIHDLHMVQSGVVLPEHLDVFERGIAPIFRGNLGAVGTQLDTRRARLAAARDRRRV